MFSLKLWNRKFKSWKYVNKTKKNFLIYMNLLMNMERCENNNFMNKIIHRNCSVSLIDS